MENKRMWTDRQMNVDMSCVGTAQSQPAALIMADSGKIMLKSLK